LALRIAFAAHRVRLGGGDHRLATRSQDAAGKA
jgi:hypothetical protein